MASIQGDAVQCASLLSDSSVSATPLVASQSKWRRSVLFAVASVAVLSVLVAFSTAQSRLSSISRTASVQPLILMQDLRLLSDDNYLPYNSGKSKDENMNMAFDHFVAKALNNELTAEEKTIFKQHFIGAMSGKCKGNAKPTASQWKDLLKDAFEGTKPELTDSMVKHINSGNNGFTVSQEPWMKEITNDDIKSRLGVIQPSGPPPPPKISAQSLPDQREFHAYEKWPQCAVVVRRDHNQGQCGSCWAFAAMSVLDSRLCIKTGGDFKEPKGHLSRTYATSCSYESRDGCQGGWPTKTFELAGSHGIPTGGSEGCLPYFAHGEGTDHFDNQQVAPACPHACIKAGYGRSLSADRFKFGSGLGTWTSQDISERTKKHRIRTVMQAIMSEGPVAATVFVDQAFFGYKSGIFKSSCHERHANHAVAAIGFGGNDCPNGYGNCPAFYWELLNSWGDHWGNNGEIKVAACVATSFQWPDPITDSHVSGLPNPLFPGSVPSPGPAFEVTGPCTLDGGNCVLTPNWPNNYGNSQQCKVTVKKQEGVKLQVVDFLLESGYDFLKVNNKKYSGSAGPNDVVAKGSIEWDSDHSVTKTGWKICEEPQIAGEDVTCDTVGDDVFKPAGETAIVKCPNACRGSSVWGSNPYSTDSALCKAAKHAGLSGTIKVKFLGQKLPFHGSSKNGVTTTNYGHSWTAMQLSS